MAMKHCPICGEEYSDTYKTCPFCEEEKAIQEGTAPRRGGRRAVKRSRQFSLITPTLIVLILIMAGLLVYLLYGDRIAEKFGPDEPPTIDELVPETPDSVEPVLPPVEEEEEEENPEVVLPEQPEPKPEPKPVDKTGYAKAIALPDGLTLSTNDFTVKVAGESNVIKASGGKGSYQWYSEDPNVASVDGSGKVTALSRGTVTIVATDGVKKGTCIVRVNVSNTTPVTPPAETSKPSNAKLSKEDYTTFVGDADVKLKVTGASGKVTWSTADSSIATVSGDGLVKAVGKGTTTVKATVDGKTLSCIVRVTR